VYRNSVTLIWSDRDWARLSEREHDRGLIPNAEMVTSARGDTFLPLGRPMKLQRLIVRFLQG
jgi:hypothetical protein